ncbi:MAG: V-type ATP synthase subunit E family protein [Bacillota bacterium]|nr:V-type ATP synthase subunit E family protein [Bacillota bacterium]
MEGLDAIILRIMADAREEASKLDRESDKTENELLKQNQETCRRIVSTAQEAGAALAGAIVNRAQSMAGLDRRKTLLAARQELIEQVLEQAMEKLCHMPKAEKVALYRQLIHRARLSEGSLVLCAADQPIGLQLIEEPDVNLVLSEQPGLFAGGLIIRSGLIEENLTYETLFKDKHAEMVSLTASILFEKSNAGQTAEKYVGNQ